MWKVVSDIFHTGSTNYLSVWIPSWITGNSLSECTQFFALCVFPVRPELFWLANQQYPWRVALAAKGKWLSWHHPSWHHPQDGRYTETINKRYSLLLPSIDTFFCLTFQKPFPRFRNDIILCYYLKFNENWCNTTQRWHNWRYHAMVLARSREWIVWFCTILPGVSIPGNLKIFVKNKIISRSTDLTLWAVFNQNQTIIFVQP